jgi:hypothetical protein
MRYAQPGLTLWFIKGDVGGVLATTDEIPEDFTVCVQTGYTEFYLFTDREAARKYVNKYIPLNPPLLLVRDVPLLNAAPPPTS